MASSCIAAPGENKDDGLTVQDANTIVTRYQSVHIGDSDTPAFEDVSINPNDGTFNYVIDGTSYSIPIDHVRHAAL